MRPPLIAVTIKTSMKTYFYAIAALVVVLLMGSAYYMVGAYNEPMSSNTYLSPKVDTGLASQSKTGSLFLSSASTNGTVAISDSALTMSSNLDRGTINVGNIGGKTLLLTQGSLPLVLGFAWNGNANNVLQAGFNPVSIGTPSTSGTLTINNGSPTSATMNIINGTQNGTIAVGAYYTNGSWQTLNTASQPMAITFDASSGLWLESGASNNGGGTTIYWRKSMQLDQSGNITFSDRLKDAPNSALQWVFQEASSSSAGVAGDILWYCSRYPCDNQNRINGTPPAELPLFKTCENGKQEYFPLIPLNNNPQYAIYSCLNGSNSDARNQIVLALGNLLVRDQSYGTEYNPNVQDFPYVDFSSSSTAPSSGFSYGTSQDDGKPVELLECPNGRYISGFTVGNVSNLTVGGKFGQPSFNIPIGPGLVMSLVCAKL